jgi:hypothetical protein
MCTMVSIDHCRIVCEQSIHVYTVIQQVHVYYSISVMKSIVLATFSSHKNIANTAQAASVSALKR